ncbi:acyltransferase [Pseudomonas sp. CCI3.2]|uniref:acyltransferase family protein n=1 Tax=unclassified Pseudomonas TaxID=196821 RepID=UPI002AC9019C|nr:MULTISPECIES: acyltransferase [unclassified Pseudomonas]MEB0078973.1 acyltransferase [Pseudomonas sp. MH10out]MEB0094339.1 acyltransferase [Pseudomonas sp. CCI4.2]MEB0101265.1 acyltransferase [Pseudomonas sp. CCI3.2]MEB0131372.1 acyltransferase [Pseudomonas sp. CCI2.4]MEB0159455.1 acyltransferase [Pseudomonas sp. AH2 (2023)]
MKQFQALNSLRGLCALAMVVHHSHVLQSITECPLFKTAHYLVEYFFALSGFVLYQRYAQSLGSTAQLRQFMVTRTCRVYPLHLFMLLVFIGFECLKLILERRGITLNNVSFTGDRAVGEIVPNLLLIQAWWPGFNALSFNYPSWIVSVGYYVCLLFGGVALMLPRQSTKAYGALAVLAVLGLYVGNTPLADNVLRGVSCFFAGGITYRIYTRLRPLRLSLLVGSVLEVMILGLIYLVMTRSETSQDAALAILFCVAVGVFAFEAGAISLLLRGRLLEWLGERWFSIYMTHAAVIFVTTVAVMMSAKLSGLSLMIDLPGTAIRYISTGSALLDNLLIMVELIAVLGVSALTYRYIERPGIALGKRWNTLRGDERLAD